MVNSVRCAWLWVPVLVLSFAGPTAVHADNWMEVWIPVNRKSMVTFWATQNGARTVVLWASPAPVQPGMLTIWVKYPTEDSDGDVAFVPAGPRGQSLEYGNQFAAILPDPQNPGGFVMPPLWDYLAGRVGLFNEVLLPAFTLSDDPDIWLATDLEAWIGAGAVPPPQGEALEFLNGVSALLPGVQVGLSRLTFDSQVGWLNTNPFSGVAFSKGRFAFQLVPEPSSAFLLSAAGLLGLRRRR